MSNTFRMEDMNISMVRGDTLSFGLVIEGLDQNLETAYFTCKKNLSDTSGIFQKSLGNGITLTDEGYVIRIAPEDTRYLEAGKYFYDLQIGVNSDIFTVLKGVLEIEQDVTT